MLHKESAVRKTIRLSYRDGSNPEVRGTVFEIDGLNGVEFVVHHPPPTDKGWDVTEAVTGLRMLKQSYTTQKDAIEATREQCSSMANRNVVRHAIAAAKAVMEVSQ